MEMSERSLLDISINNYNSAFVLYQNLWGDEAELNIVGFHLQQCLEICVKYLLELEGIRYPKTHDIEVLERLALDNSVDLHFSEYLHEHTEMFSAWEAKSRYIIDYVLEKEKVQKALKELETYLKEISVYVESQYGIKPKNQIREEEKP